MNEPTIFEAHSSYVLELLFTHDSQTLVSAGMDNVVKLWSVPDWELIRTLEGHANSVNSISLSPGRTVRSNVPRVRGLVFSPNEKTAALSTEGKVQLWSVGDWTLQAELPISTKAVNGMAFSPDGRWLTVGVADRKIRVWELQ